MHFHRTCTGFSYKRILQPPWKNPLFYAVLLAEFLNVNPQNAFSESLPGYGFQPAPLNNNDGCAITFVSETEQTRFKQIETFLGKDIYKLPVPEELGEGPVYAPRTSRKEGGKQVKNFSRNKKGGWKKKGGNHAKKQGERTVKN